MRFEWSEKKSEATLVDRGFDFAFASYVFYDNDRFVAPARTVRGEERFSVVGKASTGELLFIVFTWRQNEQENIARIISARKASRKERRRYLSVR